MNPQSAYIRYHEVFITCFITHGEMARETAGKETVLRYINGVAVMLRPSQFTGL